VGRQDKLGREEGCAGGGEMGRKKRRKKKRGRGGKVGRALAKNREREGEKRVWVFFFSNSFSNFLILFKPKHYKPYSNHFKNF
jgi:hypothetical protein